jgi:hypothetical protein
MGKQIVRLLRENWLVWLILSMIVVAFLALRTRGTQAGSVAEIDALLADGQPTLVEFYSNT